ncbi:MAG: valine--tRNA ligase [Phycisphaerae bacterium]|nr:valine--tRNA ligase [Phycisphaerae bacterium]
MSAELPKAYDPTAVEQQIYRRWTDADAFAAEPGCRPDDAFVMVIPPPNVTDVLHVGHALNNTLQDVLIRCQRMQGRTTLWMPGTDHAGIATQTVVEKRILAAEGKRRTDFQRDEFVQRVRQWKDDYERRITDQLRTMGCSCDWRRQRFTMDETCAHAVREAFFRLFAAGLIYRGKRLVNWDPATQTVLADDEVEHEDVQGHFWYMQYPLVEAVTFRTAQDRGTGVSPVEADRGTGVSPVCPTDVPSVAVDRGTGVSPVEADRGTGVSPACPTDVSSVDRNAIQKRQGANLPHWTAASGIYAVTFRLADALPRHVLDSWKQERQDIMARAERQERKLTYQERRELDNLYSARVDTALAKGHGQCHLADERIAQIVADALKHFDGERYQLHAWAIMPNHVHVIVEPLDDHGLSDICQSWKSYTSKRANDILGRSGTFWQAEYYDHLVRDQEDYHQCLQYVLGNPSAAGLENWPWVARCHGPEAHDTHGRDTRATTDDMRGQDARDTHGRDARATTDDMRGQDARDTHGQDARATKGDITITHVTVATTRPETMLGDTAVAINPADPRAQALIGKKVRLPLVGREIPIIADEHVVLPDPDSDDEQARFSTGFLKVTPAHDPNDWEIGLRHDLPVVNVMAPDGTISDRHGWDDAAGTDAEQFLDMDRFEAREAIVEWFRQEGLLEDIREYRHSVGHSYRSHVPIEPYLSDQWYIAVKQPSAEIGERSSPWEKQHPDLVEQRGEVTYLKGTDVPVNSLAGLALAPLLDGRVKFTPDRYAKTYQTWLENLRDWPISRQLWWGHRIPIWSRDLELPANVSPEPTDRGPDAQVCAALDHCAGERWGARFSDAGRYHLWTASHPERKGWLRAYVCPAPEADGVEETLEAMGFQQDPDVLDTWFSSALWPFSTMGWPEETPEMGSFYPGDVLCTAREIITLWVSRMVMMGQFCCGDIPFADVFIHAMIQDGEGRKMSKSLGNGIDPLDIIHSHGADAMRFTLVSMTTQTQDVRMPVEEMTTPDGRTVNSSPKFDAGRNFCNKLWNASRFALMNLDGCPLFSDIRPREHLADRWILSRLSATIRDVTGAIDAFRFNEVGSRLYHFVWDEFCDWYLEIAKTRISAGDETPKAVLAHALDVICRLLHPVAPFITEAIWEKLDAAAPVRGPGDQPAEDLLCLAAWPHADAADRNEVVERHFAVIQEIVRSIRDARQQHNTRPSRQVDAVVEATGEIADVLADNVETLASQARLGDVRVAQDAGEPPSGAAVVTSAGAKVYLLDIVDVAAEKARLAKQRDELAKGIRAAEGKLDNENFVEKAPAEVVQRERDRLAQMQRDLAAVDESLDALGR